MAPVGAAALRSVVPSRTALALVENQERAPRSSERAAPGATRPSQAAEWSGQSRFESGTDRLRLRLLGGGAEAAAPATRPAGAAQVAPTGQSIQGRTNPAMDGQLMTTDGGGTTWGTGVAPSQVPGANGRETVLWVNGIDTTAGNHQDTLRLLEQGGGTRAVGLYNATEGRNVLGLAGADMNQTFADQRENAQRAAGTWQGPSQNAATRSLSDAIVSHLNTSQEPLHLMAHSQGAVITANALYDARQRLTAQHGAERANELMGRLQVETFGGAARNYVDGPRYTHWINNNDNVTGGMGPNEQTGGRGATFRRFDDNRGVLNHNFQDVYWAERQRQMQAH